MRTQGCFKSLLHTLSRMDKNKNPFDCRTDKFHTEDESSCCAQSHTSSPHMWEPENEDVHHMGDPLLWWETLHFLWSGNFHLFTVTLLPSSKLHKKSCPQLHPVTSMCCVCEERLKMVSWRIGESSCSSRQSALLGWGLMFFAWASTFSVLWSGLCFF